MMRALTEELKGTAILLTCEDDENVLFYRKAGFRTHKRVMALGYRGWRRLSTDWERINGGHYLFRGLARS